MTTEQKTELKRIMGNAEEVKNDLNTIGESLDTEYDAMSGDEQAENPDLNNLIGDIEDLAISLSDGISGIMERMEIV